jgi:adenosylmethionine-8-amino-7-oxononanoate aminotransferase
VDTDTDAIFPRRFGRHYPYAVRGEGVYLFDESGKRYFDAVSGAAVANIGHGVHEIVERMSHQAEALAFAHTSQFHTRAAAGLAGRLRTRFPGPAQSVLVHFTPGGSEATETAIKIVRKHWIHRGEHKRYKIISRWHGYHGATLGALALSGRHPSREPYLPLLPEVEHISACFCYHCPLKRKYPSCELACATELEAMIKHAGPESVAAFILEPVVGATSGAVPPDGYVRLVREICDRYGILMIDDEVMMGGGRTGTYFAIEHWGVVPDIILIGKGLTAGYMPLGAVLVGERVWQPIAAGNGTLNHGFTYQGHPPSVAAGLAVQEYLEKHRLVERARDRGEYLARRLQRLCRLACVGDVRGKGLLQTVEFVSDKPTREPFPIQLHFAELVSEQLLKRGVVVGPMSGTVDGERGDHILIAPPFIVEEAQIDWFVQQLLEAITQVYQEDWADRDVITPMA